MLYDLSSSYVEGRCCPLASLGYSRDGVRGKAQVTYGLTCSPEGRPVAISVHEGRTQDQQTLPAAVALVRERFGIADVVVVGDRGMLTQAHATSLTEAGVDFVSALKSTQIRKLVAAGDLQLSLFDETNLAEISSAEFPGERLVVCRNPALAAERARKRERAAAGHRGRTREGQSDGRGPARIASQSRRRQDRRARRTGLQPHKVAKHFQLEIADGAFSYARKTEQIEAEAALDGLYVIRTTCPTSKAPQPGRGRGCLQTAQDGRAGLPHDERPDRDPPHLPPPRRPRPRPRLPLHARLLRRLRTPPETGATPLHRHRAAPTHRPGRPRQALPRRQNQGQPAKRRRTATPPTTSPT